MTLGAKLKQLRLEQNLSQQKLSQLVGTSPSTINRYEKDLRNPKIPMLNRLAEVLQVNLDFLVNTSTAPPPSLEGSQWIPVSLAPPLGISAQTAEEVVSYEEISPQTARFGRYFALRIQGQHMEPQIYDQDLLIVRTQEDCENGDIAVIRLNNDRIIVKRIKKEVRGIILIPNNPAYDPLFYTNQEINSLPVQILGKVIEVRRKL